MMRLASVKVLLILLALVGSNSLYAQDLEPRRWNHLPDGLNIIAVGYARSKSDIYFNPALNIEDGASDVNAWVLQYQRAFNFFGKSARADVRLPYVSGHWEGIVGGTYEQISRRKGGDPWFRLSVNLYGAPALAGDEYLSFVKGKARSTVVGASISIGVPLGGYNPENLINIGSNRWAIRPQLGVEHTRGRWTMELTGSVFLFTSNDDFLGDLKLEQEQIYTLQSHLTYTFKSGIWLSLGAGYGNGGEIDISGVRTAYSVDNWVYGGGLGYAINRSQSIRLAWASGRTQNTVGRDFDSAVLSWSIKWQD